MSTTRITWKQIGAVSTLFAAASGLGSGISAAIRGGNIAESASVTALGTGLSVASFGIVGRFGLFKAKADPAPEPAYMHILVPAFIELIGTSVGYLGTKLFITAAVSTEPFIDAGLGFSITAGVFFCATQLRDYYEQLQNVKNTSLKPHAP